jgi:hypothetical protein
VEVLFDTGKLFERHSHLLLDSIVKPNTPWPTLCYDNDCPRRLLDLAFFVLLVRHHGLTTVDDFDYP